MVIVKRKAVPKSASRIFRGRTNKKVDPEEKQMHETTEEDSESERSEEQEDEEEVNKEEAMVKREEELAAARKKELKSMPVNDLKELAQGQGLETGKREDMVEALLAHEADVRAKERIRQGEMREVVMNKMEELKGLSVPELKGLSDAAGAKGVMTKQARVELLLRRWQEDDGVDKAMAKRARDAREQQLLSMDKVALRRLCESVGVQPFVKEVMAQRIVMREAEQGFFSRPRFENEVDENAQARSKAKKPMNMVESLLVEEANRKIDKESKQRDEEAAAHKRKELRSMSVEELKKQLTEKGNDAIGKKEDLVEALFEVGQQESKLKSLSLDELKQRVLSRGLETSKNAKAMVVSLMKHEANQHEKCKAYDVKVIDALRKKKEALEEMTAVELKDLCASRSLRLGVGKQERVETLLEDARTNGDVDKMVASAVQEAKKKDLLAMELSAVLEVCEKIGVDPMVKEVAIEQLLAYEDEHGPTEVEEKRPIKRARTAGKN